jgi:hypothetical protein
MARAPRTFARRSHAEAKAGENIGQSKPREDVTGKAKQTNQQEDISDLSLTRSPCRFLRVLRLLPPCATSAFTDEGCVMVAPGAKGSFPSSTDDATKPKNIIALSNPHTRTTGFQGTRMYMPESPGTKSGSRFTLIVLPKVQTCFVNILPEFLRSHRNSHRPHRRARGRGLATIPNVRLFWIHIVVVDLERPCPSTTHFEEGGLVICMRCRAGTCEHRHSSQNRA